MQTTNNMGFVSGGYIFDRLDRFAQSCIKTDYKYVMTAEANITYYKQCCDVEDIGLVWLNEDDYEQDESHWHICCQAVSVSSETVYVQAEFDFVGKMNNYCETKES